MEQETKTEMDPDFKKVAAIVLAAGEGTRLNSGRPSKLAKVLYPLAGKPMILYTMDLLSRLGINHPVVVVGSGANLVKKTLGAKFVYSLQEKPAGTADATRKGLAKIVPKIRHVLVLNGDDSAFYQVETLKKLVRLHLVKKAKVSFLTTVKANPQGLGRIIRDRNVKVERIIEEKAATKTQKAVKEVNVGCYIFDKDWLAANIKKIPRSAVGEYYLTDIIEIATKTGVKIETLECPPDEVFGVNTPQELKLADSLMRSIGAG